MAKRSRDPDTNCKCTRCEKTGDQNFNRTLYGTLESHCKECHNKTQRDRWRRTKMTTQPRIKDK
jgi:hypothetical protein